MTLRQTIVSLLYLYGVQRATVAASAIQRSPAPTATHNNFACRSAIHPNPVIILHGLSCNTYSCISTLTDFLGASGFCTFSTVYGISFVPSLGIIPIPFGGVAHIKDSAPEVVAFVHQVLALTGAAQVDMVGHSEGAFMSLWVAKFYPELNPYTSQIVALAPPTHGTDFSNFYDMAYIFGKTSRKLVSDFFQTVQCGACDDLGIGGPAVIALNANGPIAQPGIQYTILATQDDEFVTPPPVAFVDEPGVRNIYIQDYCPDDITGHHALSYDVNVQQVVRNTLLGHFDAPITCLAGPGMVDTVLGIAEGLEHSDLTLPEQADKGLKDILASMTWFR